MNLNTEQQRAVDEILAARARGAKHLLIGPAGTGKTYLMQNLAKEWRAKGFTVAMTAPTHKAVAVLAKKLQQAGLDDIRCCTIHRLLGLKPKPDGDKLVFVRDRKAEPIDADVVVIDECSMLSADMMAHIRRHMTRAFVLFSGDKAQLPPVGEVESLSFGTKSRSELTQIVRQAEGNPIIVAAHAIRLNQGQAPDWSWMKEARVGDTGVFIPNGSADAWMKKAFTSEEFDQDSERYRYLAWTNTRVAEVNRQVRQWRYGDNIPTPFMPGERAMFRAPVMRDEDVLFGTNEEATVESIERSVFRNEFEPASGVDGWAAELPSWRIVLDKGDEDYVEVHMPHNERDFERVLSRVKDEALECGDRWGHLHEFKSAVARMQSIYAQTIHTAQGSTHGFSFVDIRDIRKRERDNPLEAQQILYTAVTRPSHGLVLVGV